MTYFHRLSIYKYQLFDSFCPMCSFTSPSIEYKTNYAWRSAGRFPFTSKNSELYHAHSEYFLPVTKSSPTSFVCRRNALCTSRCIIPVLRCTKKFKHPAAWKFPTVSPPPWAGAQLAERESKGSRVRWYRLSRHAPSLPVSLAQKFLRGVVKRTSNGHSSHASKYGWCHVNW